MTPAILFVLLAPLALALWTRSVARARCNRCGRPAVLCAFPLRCPGRR